MRTPPPAQPAIIADPEPLPRTTEHYGMILNEMIGRLPTIGIDSGAIPGTRPDQRY